MTVDNSSPAPARPLRVLFVEDSVLDTELVCAELRRGGFDVQFQRVDTEAALQAALLDEVWDLVISDFSMPRFDGLQAFEVYHKMNLDIPFIYVSGAMGEERAVRAMQAGAKDYILKGHLGRLNAAVQRELSEAQSRRLRRQMEADKHRERSRLAMALQATGAGVFEYSVTTSTGHWNERFAEIFGVPVEELPTVPQFRHWLLERVHPDDRRFVVANQQDFILGKIPELGFECRIRHADGRWREVSFALNALHRDSLGRAVDVVGVMLDHTKERRMEEQFRQAQKMEAVGRLAGGVAHDFNNLLTVISNFGDFVLQRLEPGSEVHADMQEVLKAATRAEALTSQLLAYSRHRPVMPVVLNPNELVAEMDKMLRRLLGESIALTTDLAENLWRVRIDPGGFEQVLMNLVVNARDAMPAGGRLSIATSNVDVGEDDLASRGADAAPGQYVQVTVTDSGEGMDPDTLARLFEPFFTTKEAGKGTGLGLATCFGIVKQAGGFIWVVSQPGRGASFRLFLPRESAPKAETVQDMAEAGNLRGRETILVVEDDEPVRKIVFRLLSGLGYDVLEAADGVEALSVVASTTKHIDALLTDVVMPGAQGPELAKEVTRLKPDIKVIYMSGYTRGAIEMSDTIVLVQKPFAPKDLARKLRAVLDRELPKSSRSAAKNGAPQ